MKTYIFLLFLLITMKSALSQNPDYDVDALVIAPGNGGSHSYTAGSWVQLAGSPNAVSRSCCVYIVVNGVPYLYQFGGGNSTSELRRVGRLNLLTNTWTGSYSQMPFQISAGTALAFKGDSVVFVVGGNNQTLGKTLRYNVYANTWSVMSDMNARVTDALVLKYDEDHFYVIGGGDGYFGNGALKTNVIQMYTLSSNSYSMIGTYPIPCSMLGGGIFQDTIVAVGGYTTGGTATANCYKGGINPADYTISWTPIDPYPAGPIVRMASHIAIVGEGKGVMCTGGAVNGITPIASTYLWNFCTQSWQSGLPNNSLARSNYKATGKNDGIIYSVAGYTTTGVGTTERFIFSFIDGPCNMSGVAGNSSIIPESIYLSQNYPNPFNPSTVIRFGIPKGDDVRIVVRDITGRIVYRYEHFFSVAGNYEITFDGSQLSSGVYFYSLTAADNTVTKKMLLVK